MPNPYKDEKGHWTSKENDGGPCNHNSNSTNFDDDYEEEFISKNDEPDDKLIEALDTGVYEFTMIDEDGNVVFKGYNEDVPLFDENDNYYQVKNYEIDELNDKGIIYLKGKHEKFDGYDEPKLYSEEEESDDDVFDQDKESDYNPPIKERKLPNKNIYKQYFDLGFKNKPKTYPEVRFDKKGQGYFPQVRKKG